MAGMKHILVGLRVIGVGYDGSPEAEKHRGESR